MKYQILIILILCFACQPKDSEEFHLQGKTMGTVFNIKYIGNEETPRAHVLLKEVGLQLKELNNQMSTYQKDSEISFFNKNTRLNWYPISGHFFKVLKHNIEIANKTKGVFDPTIGPLVNLWGFGPTGDRKVPTKKKIEMARLKVGYEKIKIDSATRSIRKTMPGVYLDLSASAKGYGVDIIAEYLEKTGIKNFMVEIGGEVRTKGVNKQKSAWKIAISRPSSKVENQKPYFQVLELKDMALATSGDYRNFFEKKGKKYSHTINYRTGSPIESTLASVSVAYAGSCMHADSYATALMAMGADKGLQFAQKNKIAAFFIYKENGQDGKKFVTRATDRFKLIFKKQLTP